MLHTCISESYSILRGTHGLPEKFRDYEFENLEAVGKSIWSKNNHFILSGNKTFVKIKKIEEFEMTITAQIYPTDLTNSQWDLIKDLLPKPKSGPGKPGRPTVDIRQAINGILYVNKTGCQWRMVPKEFGNWNTVYYYFKEWRKAGVWKDIMDVLTRKERERQGRNPEPSAGCVDCQSVKTVTQGNEVGYDGGKMIDGRKRHILVDTLGLILVIFVTAANVNERIGLKKLLKDYFSKGVRRLRKIWADSGYSGKGIKNWVYNLKKSWKVDLDVVEKEGKGFNLVKRRWVVERTFGWLNNFRRHSKDYEVLPCNSEAMIQISMISILLRRLA